MKPIRLAKILFKVICLGLLLPTQLTASAEKAASGDLSTDEVVFATARKTRSADGSRAKVARLSKEIEDELHSRIKNFEQSSAIVDYLVYLGRLAVDERKTPKIAVECLELALKMHRELNGISEKGPGTAACAELLRFLADAYNRGCSQLGKSIPCLEEALAVVRRIYKQGDADAVAFVLNDLSMHYRHGDNMQFSLGYGIEGMDMWHRIIAKLSSEGKQVSLEQRCAAAESLENVAWCYSMMNRNNDAVELYKAALAHWTIVAGGEIATKPRLDCLTKMAVLMGDDRTPERVATWDIVERYKVALGLKPPPKPDPKEDLKLGGGGGDDDDDDY